MSERERREREREREGERVDEQERRSSERNSRNTVRKFYFISFLLQFKVLCAFNTFVIKLNTIYDTIFFFVSAFFPYALSQTLSLFSLSHSLACRSFSMSLSLLTHTHSLTHSLSLSSLLSFTLSLVAVSPCRSLSLSPLSHTQHTHTLSPFLSCLSTVSFSLVSSPFLILLFSCLSHLKPAY